MGHRNTQSVGHMIDMEDQQGHCHLHPEPCVVYGSLPNFPPPNFNIHHVPEHHGNGLFYRRPHYSMIQPQHPPQNIDFAVGLQSSHYNPYLVPSSGIIDFPVHVNQGANEQFSLPPIHSSRNYHYMDDMGGSFKRKSAEGAPVNFQCHTASAGPSSSVAPMNARLAEPDPAPFMSDSASIVRSGFIGNVRNSPGIVGPESVTPHNAASHLIQGSYVVPPVQLPYMPFGANNGDIGTYTWAPSLSYAHYANVNGACLEPENMGMQGYQLPASNRSSVGFLHPPVTSHHPRQTNQGMRGYSFPPQVANSSHRNPSVSSSHTGINAFHRVADPAATILASGQPTGFRMSGHGHHRRDLALDPYARHRNYLRVLPEDEVAILEPAGYHEAGESLDQLRDMRLDIDHMSYEELIALGEQIGSVGTGLSEEFVRNNLKTRTFASSAVCINLGEATCPDQQIDFCVICQTDYKDKETIGSLDCGHEYHRKCVNKWLQMKNTCPVCKSTAVKGKGKEMLII